VARFRFANERNAINPFDFYLHTFSCRSDF
jgi:hypothetical protein